MVHGISWPMGMWAFLGPGIEPVSPELQMNEEGFPGGSEGEESACNAGDPGSIPELGRYSEEGNGNPFQCSGLENCMDRGSLAGYSPRGHEKLDMAE